MAGIIRAKLNPGILVWAREQAGISPEAAARKAGASIERLLSWETGTAQPTLRQARLLAKAYRRPSALFYLESPPHAPPELRDFRRLPEEDTEQTPNLLYEVRRARFRREIALEIFRGIDEEVPSFALTASPDEPADTVGARLRSYLGVEMDEQFSWSSSYEALKNWAEAAEAGGVLVFQFSGIDVSVLRGFSISEHPLPVLSLNAKDAPHGRVFTLLHELCHVALGAGGLCDLHEDDRDLSLEAYCNAAAAAALVPSRLLLSQPEVARNLGDPQWSDDTLRALSGRFHVSREVVLRRLLTVGRTTTAFYQRKRDEFREEYEALRGEGTGFAWYHKIVLRNNGTAFTSLLLDAYHQEVITAIDVSRYLGAIRLNHLESIQHELTR